MTATCRHCQTTQDVDPLGRNEDGSPAIENTRCASPGCEVFLCEAGCTHLSFSCDGCDARFCLDHRIRLDELALCFGCAVQELEDNEPQDCTCQQTDVDLFDPRGCEAHDSESAWNVRYRALTSTQEYERNQKEVA